ncbi:MAG: hypothetical protein R3C12_20125 [Planctomycetaceae bacterium]|nr:hypothetical protein [Planctomycetaceae bacterium]
METHTDPQEAFHESGRQYWRRVMPWLHLLRVPGVAGSPRVLLAGFVASYVFMLFDLLTLGLTIRDRLPTLERVLELPVNFGLSVLAPNTMMYLFLSVASGRSVTLYPFQLSAIVFVHLLGGLFISRLAAGMLTQGTSPPVDQAARFSLVKFPSLMLALAFPLLAIALLAGLASGLVLLERIPLGGPWLAGICYGPVLLLTFFAMIVAVGLVVGWPLLVATLATENSDGFDAWSRSFDYLRSRILPILISAGLTLMLGLAVLVLISELAERTFSFVNLLQSRLLHLPANEIAQRANATFADGPSGFQNLWRTLGMCVIHGYILTLYWTTVVAIYVQARLSVDRIPLDEFQT